MQKKELLYPIFLECCQFTSDIFWENIFEELAYGKTPYGTYISKNFLICNNRKKNFSYKITFQDAKTVYTDIYQILVNKLGLLSQREKIKQRLELQESEKKIKASQTDWASIRKKNVKEILIEQYVVRMKTLHNLSVQEARYLLSVIYMAMMFKVITSKDIEYNNGRINHIENIDFEQGKVILGIDIYDCEASITSKPISPIKLLSDNWGKYLNEIKKIEKQYTCK